MSESSQGQSACSPFLSKWIKNRCCQESWAKKQHCEFHQAFSTTVMWAVWQQTGLDGDTWQCECIREVVQQVELGNWTYFCQDVPPLIREASTASQMRGVTSPSHHDFELTWGLLVGLHNNQLSKVGQDVSKFSHTSINLELHKTGNETLTLIWKSTMQFWEYPIQCFNTM